MTQNTNPRLGISKVGVESIRAWQIMIPLSLCSWEFNPESSITVYPLGKKTLPPVLSANPCFVEIIWDFIVPTLSDYILGISRIFTVGNKSNKMDIQRQIWPLFGCLLFEFLGNPQPQRGGNWAAISWESNPPKRYIIQLWMLFTSNLIPSHLFPIPSPQTLPNMKKKIIPYSKPATHTHSGFPNVPFHLLPLSPKWFSKSFQRSKSNEKSQNQLISGWNIT